MAQVLLGAGGAGTSAAACQTVLQNQLPAGAVPRFVVVVDIGQGNCNVVFDDDGRPIIYYDLGGGINGNQFTYPVPAPTFCFDVAHCLFMLSHWDGDHNLSLDISLNNGLLANMVCLAPNQRTFRNGNLTALTLSGAIAAAGTLNLWRDEDLTALSGNYLATHNQFTVIKVTFTNVNNTGLALRLLEPGGAGQCMLLTGDATFERHLPATANRQTFPHGCDQTCVGLVAAHHGARVGAPGDVPRPLPAVGSNLIAYSFGWGNEHAHPNSAGVAQYDGRGWDDDHRMDTGGAELAARYAGPRGNVGLQWPGAAFGPGKVTLPSTPLKVDRAAVALLATTAAEVDTCGLPFAGRYAVAAGAAYQAALESHAPDVANALSAPATGTLTAVANGLLVGAAVVSPALTGAIAAAPGATGAGGAAAVTAQHLARAVVDCVSIAAARGAQEITASAAAAAEREEQAALALGGNADLPTRARAAATEAYAAAGHVDIISEIAAAIPDEALQAVRAAASAIDPNAATLPDVPGLRTAVAQTVADALQKRIGQPGTQSLQPWQAANDAAAQTVALARQNISVALAAAAGCTPAVPIDPGAGAPDTIIDNENAKVLGRVAAVAALAGPVVNPPAITRGMIAGVAAAAARVALAAAQGAPQVGCHRHPRTCPNAPCSLSVHYFHGMFPARIRAVAGNGNNADAGDNGLATAASFMAPGDVVQDKGFNLYLSDAGAHRIRRISRAGVITTLTGTGVAGYGGDANAAATAARLDAPAAVAFDKTRNHLYLADRARHRVRRVDLSTGQISAVAGTGVQGAAGDGGPASAAQLSAPAGLAYDITGHALYIADTGNDCVRRVDLATGRISTAVGQAGNPGNSLDGVAVDHSQLRGPTGLFADGTGELFIADTGNHRIRVVRDGTLVLLAGTGAAGFAGDGAAATLAVFNAPSGVAVDGNEEVWVADTGNRRIRRIDTAGLVATFAGTGVAGSAGDNGVPGAATFQTPSGLAVDDVGDVYIADPGANCVRKIDVAVPRIVRFAGTGMAGNLGDAAAAVNGQLNAPLHLAWAEGTVVIADTGSHRVRSVDATGNLRPVAGDGNQDNTGDAVSPAAAAQLRAPGGMAYDRRAHALYLADSGNHCVRRVDLATGSIFRIAGQPGNAAFGGDNDAASAAQLNNPTDLALDDAIGVLYVCDAGNNRVRAITLATGVITTTAGDGNAAFAGDNGLPAAARLFNPASVAVDREGNLYIGTTGDHRVRQVEPGVDITTVAGTGAAGAAGDGGAPAAAQLSTPAGLAVDGAGNLYISCTGSHKVRLVNSARTSISTIVGTGAAGFAGDDGLPVNAQLSAPRGLYVDEAGRNLFIAETGNRRIRRGYL